jgi:hypothetical protein
MIFTVNTKHSEYNIIIYTHIPKTFNSLADRSSSAHQQPNNTHADNCCLLSPLFPPAELKLLELPPMLRPVFHPRSDKIASIANVPHLILIIEPEACRMSQWINRE